MSKKVDTWMPWYVADYLADTTNLSTERHGAYCLMLMAAWKRGGTLPKDDKQLAEITKLGNTKWRQSKAVLLEFFEEGEDCYRHKRVTKERVKAQAISDAKANNGAKGAASRWEKDGKPDGKPDGEAVANGMANAMANEMAEGMANASRDDAHARVFLPSQVPIPSVLGQSIPSESKDSGGDPPTNRELVFSMGVPLITAAGVKESNARSMLAVLCKTHGESAVVEAINITALAHPGDPVSWLQAVLKTTPTAAESAKPDRHPQWCLDAGFANIEEAGNERCYKHNAHEFRGGKKIKGTS